MKIKDIKHAHQVIKQFHKERGWLKNQVPGSLAKSIMIEGAELLEHFQWDEGDSRSATEIIAAKDKQEISDEVADVFWYLLTFCDHMQIDILKALGDKYEKNAKKYPAEKMKQDKSDQEYLRIKKKARSAK